MPIIKTLGKYKDLEVSSGANIFTELFNNHIPIASSCKGDGICKKCLVQVHEGLEGLNPKTEFESDCHGKERLACQCWLQQNVTISTTYW